MSGWELILSSRKMKMIANVFKIMVSYSLIFIAYNKAVLLLLLHLAIQGASQKICIAFRLCQAVGDFFSIPAR